MTIPAHSDPNALLAQAVEHVNAGRHAEAKALLDTPAVLAVISRCALRVAKKFGVDGGTYLGVAYEKVWRALEQGRFEPGRRLEPWCYTVVLNAARDDLEKENRYRDHVAAETDRSTPDSPGLVASAEDKSSACPMPWADELFPPRDLDTIREWPVEQRVLILGVLGLWKKVPPDEWAAWLAELIAEDSSALTRELELLDDRERVSLIGALLGLNDNTAWKRWIRHRHWLVHLVWFWSDALDNRSRFNANQVRDLLKSADVLARLVIVCLTPNWFRAPLLGDFAAIVELHNRRADFPWLRFLEKDGKVELTHEDRLAILAGQWCGLRRSQPELAEIWDNQAALRSRLVVPLT